LKEYGVTKGELARYLNALLKDSEHLAAMIDNVPSVDNLDFIMESDALGHTVMDQQQGHESLLGVAETVTLEDVGSMSIDIAKSFFCFCRTITDTACLERFEFFLSRYWVERHCFGREQVNAAAAGMLNYVADFGKPTAPLPSAIVACVPKTLHVDGQGDMPFDITPEAILDALLEGLNETLAPEPEVCLSCFLVAVKAHCHKSSTDGLNQRVSIISWCHNSLASFLVRVETWSFPTWSNWLVCRDWLVQNVAYLSLGNYFVPWTWAKFLPQLA
jgi:hypothetical protein